METRKSKISERKELVKELTTITEGLRGELNGAKDGRGLREFKFDTNEEILDVTIDKNVAKPGTYQLEVVQLAQKSSAMTSGFEDADESYVGVGFIQYNLPNGDNKEIYIDADNSSLNKIAKLINKDESNGLRASVINDGSGTDTPWRMILSLEETGDENLAEFPYFYFVDGDQDLFLEFEREAHDAVVKLDGFELELPKNSTSELIPGVTLDLLKASPGQEFALNISEDSQAITDKIDGIITKVNEVFAFIKQQNTLDENTDTSRTLGGDIMLQSLEGRLRAVIFKDIITEFGPKRIGELGVTFQRDGMLKLDKKKFEATVASNFKMSSQILTGFYGKPGTPGQNGVFDYLHKAVGNSLRAPDGLLRSRAKSLQNNIDQIDRRIKDRQRMIDQKEKNLKDKFARLEGTISRLQSQGAGISALGAQANDPVTQLG